MSHGRKTKAHTFAMSHEGHDICLVVPGKWLTEMDLGPDGWTETSSRLIHRYHGQYLLCRDCGDVRFIDNSHSPDVMAIVAWSRRTLATQVPR